MSLSFIVVAEARADLATACRLADRVFCETVDWLEEEYLPSNRQWRGLTEQSQLIPWSQIKRLAKEAGLPPIHGPFDGSPAAPDAKAARRALQLIKLKGGHPSGVVLIRDADDEPERLTGLNQARTASPLNIPVVVGVAFPKREAWVIAGFEPSCDGERACLDQLRQELGFDPTCQAHALTATGDTDKKSAKRVLRQLLGLDLKREAVCLEVRFVILRDRGKESGLSAFLDEIETRLVPLFQVPTQIRRPSQDAS